MHFNWNRSFSGWLASSLAAVLATTSLHAIPRGPCDPKPEACCEEPKPGPFAFAYPMDIGLSCPRDFFAHGEGLAFQAKQDGMEFAIYNATSASTGTPMSNGKLIGFSSNSNDWGYNPGFRFGVGFFLDHDNWLIDFNWTWLNIAEYKKFSAVTGGARLHPTWLVGSGTNATQIGPAVSASWDANYDVLDAILAKPFHVSRYFILSPYFGIRGGWIQQTFNVHYQGTNTSATGVSTGVVSRNENNFWGVGARGGLGSEWLLGKGWELFTNVSSSMLFGKFEIQQQSTIPPSTNDGIDLDYDYYQNVPNMEIAIGLGWGKHFSKQRYHVGIRAAYEFIQWFDQFNLNRFYSGNPTYASDTVSRGNLTLNGFSLRFQFDI